MRILVTNDDGVTAPGIRALAQAMKELGDVAVVAPDTEQSAMGHALTLKQPLRVQELGAGVFGVSGTPTDCVLLAVQGPLLDARPDLVVSGVNAGPNMGDDVTYSGTVSAAFEGTLLGIPSIAVSLATYDDYPYDSAAACAARVARAVIARGLPPKTLLNVNVPPLEMAEIQGYRLTRLGHRIFRNAIVTKTDPRGRPYYWVAGTPEWDVMETSDMSATQEGFVSVTPLNMDMTDYKLLVDMEDWAF